MWICQLGEVEFFFSIISPDSHEVCKDSKSQSTDSKIPHVLLTKLGCESELAKLDNRIIICGGTTQTIFFGFDYKREKGVLKMDKDSRRSRKS